MDPALSILKMIPGAVAAITLFYSSAWVHILSSVIATCAVVAAATPNQIDNKVIQFFRDVIEWGAINFGHAKSVPTEKKK